MEGELARTIRSVDNIKSARVHLVLPKREMFSREEQMPSASVIIKTAKGKLSLQNIQSIQKLVAAAVPKLDVKNVAIVDNAGNLLTNNFDDEETVNNANNEIMRLEAERKLAAKVQNLLEKPSAPAVRRRRSISKWILTRWLPMKKFMIPTARLSVRRLRLPKRATPVRTSAR